MTTVTSITLSVLALLQIIFNLLGNALKFTTEGYIRVTVKPLPAAGVGMDMVQLSVEDTGCGIAKDKQKLIFEAFGQVSTAETRQAQRFLAVL